MFKRILIPLLLIIALISTGVVVCADGKNTKNLETPTVEIINYTDTAKTFEKAYVLCGRAKEGTVIELQQYWFKSYDEKAIVSKRKAGDTSKDEGEWILQGKEEWTVGASGYFAKPINWINGKNRIKLTATDSTDKASVVTMDVELVSKQELDYIFNSHIINSIDGRL